MKTRTKGKTPLAHCEQHNPGHPSYIQDTSVMLTCKAGPAFRAPCRKFTPPQQPAADPPKMSSQHVNGLPCRRLELLAIPQHHEEALPYVIIT